MSREIQNKRRVELEIKERQAKARKLKTAMEVKKQKGEAAQKKAALEAKYHEHLRQSYADRIQAEESVYMVN